MTTSVWDKAEIDSQFAECHTLAEIIEQLEQDFSSRGEVICEIRVNGQVIHEEEQGVQGANERSEIRSLMIASEHPESLIRGALGSGIEMLTTVKESGVRAADLFRGPDQRSAQGRFAETIEGCQWFVDTVQSVRGAAEGIGIGLQARDRWIEAETSLVRVINDVLNAYEKRDFVLVADLLEYELNNSLDIWAEVLKLELKQRLVQAQPIESP